MFSEIWEIIVNGIKKVVKSRLFVVSILFLTLFIILVVRLFDLQIINGQEYQDNYVQRTLTTVSVSGTRGISMTETERCWRIISWHMPLRSAIRGCMKTDIRETRCCCV